VLAGDGATPGALLSAINMLEQNEEKRAAMAAASLKIGKKDGAGFIAQALADEIKKITGGDK